MELYFHYQPRWPTANSTTEIFKKKGHRTKLQNILDTRVVIADVEAMEQEGDEGSHVCEGTNAMESSKRLVQGLHVLGNLRTVSVIPILYVKEVTENAPQARYEPCPPHVRDDGV